MASGIKLAKHAGKAKQSDNNMERSKQAQANRFLGDVYDALLSLDAQAACGFIKKTHNIKFCNTYNTKYALHAVLVLLAANTHDWSAIFNEMTNLELKNLKECISAVQHEHQPKAELTKRYLLKNIFDMADDQDLNLSQIMNKIQTLPFNKKIRAKTLFIVMTVAESWDVVTNELNNLSDAIGSFKRASRQIAPVAKPAEKPFVTTCKFEMWATEELRQKMGYKNLKVLQSIKSQVVNQHPERRGEIKSWFSRNGKFFIAEHFEDFKSLCQMNGKSDVKKNVAKAASDKANAPTTTVAVPVEINVIEDETPIAIQHLKPNTNFDKKSETQPENEATFDQVAIVGIQTFVQGFLELCENRNKKAAEYTATMDAANSETDLIKRAIEINQDLSVPGAKIETDSVIYDKISQPLQDRENAIKQLDAANSTLSNIRQEIKQNIK